MPVKHEKFLEISGNLRLDPGEGLGGGRQLLAGVEEVEVEVWCEACEDAQKIAAPGCRVALSGFD
jgi:hypothetical protein